MGNSQRLKAANKSLTLKKLSGTVAFMAPEMLKKYSVSPSADVYALAITIWQLLKRAEPYEGLNNEEQVIYGVVKNNLRPSHQEEEKKDNDGNGHAKILPSWRLFKKWPHSPVQLHKFSPLPTTEGLIWQHPPHPSEQRCTDDSTDTVSSGINWRVLFSTIELKGVAIVPPSIQLKYQTLYTKCWHRKPTHRPLITTIIAQLNDLLRKLGELGQCL